MKVDNATSVSRNSAGVPPVAEPVPLEQQLGLPPAQSAPDPEFDRFYAQFMKWMNGTNELPRGNVQSYLNNYTDAAGERPYRTTKEQTATILKVMEAMKAQGLDQTPEYKELTKAYGQVFGVDLFIKAWMAEIFTPNDDDDSQENIDW
ncbi:hypothetical protein RBU55_18410 [Pseudomonas chlororaphis subsp. aurantiaca]|uniref:hypothetical protein n=1 Tax=Pseudomonas chlororaphis TaxID=587753 RepID=UPI0027DC0687|nr:hypothetical protein [Pseudomonas chlororaphis]WMI97539.1 hypothetical protein RBU55_18410 [Pseudomonas chlororaphis subsp. aurantiaca]